MQNLGGIKGLIWNIQPKYAVYSLFMHQIRNTVMAGVVTNRVGSVKTYLEVEGGKGLMLAAESELAKGYDDITVASM